MPILDAEREVKGAAAGGRMPRALADLLAVGSNVAVIVESKVDVICEFDEIIEGKGMLESIAEVLA